MSLRSPRKLRRQRGEAVSVGAPRPAVTGRPARQSGLCGAHAWRELRGTGGRVWEVRASAFEVELLPCLNYVRPSVRSGPGAEARPPGGAGGARAVVPAQVRVARGARGPAPLGPREEWRSVPFPGPCDTRGEVSGHRPLVSWEVATEEREVRALRLCVFTRGSMGEAQGRLGRASLGDRVQFVLVTSTPVLLLFLFSSHLSLLQVKND